MELSLLSKDGMSRRLSWEKLGTTRRNEKSSGRLALCSALHVIS